MLERDRTVLLFVDVQGRLAELMQDREALFDNLRRLVGGARALGVPVLVTEQNPAKLGATRDEFAEALAEVPRIAKMTFACGGSPEFVAALAALGRRQVLVAGIETHVCIYQTVAGLLADGYEVQVVADAVSSRQVGNRQIGLQRCRDLGAVLTSTEMALMELTGSADDPVFRDILRLIR